MCNCRELLLRAIYAQEDAPGTLKFSALFVPFLMVLFIVAFSTDRWLVSSEHNDSRFQGLWRTCFEDSGKECCGYINDIIYTEPYLKATRAFLVISMLPQIICFLVTLIGIFGYNSDADRTEISRVAGVGAGVSAMFILLAVTVFGGASRDTESTSIYNLAGSYILCTITGFLYIPVTITLICS